jgi:hypothetical protein
MNSNSLLIAWTIRLSMLLLFVVFALLLRLQSEASMGRWLKYVWTASFVMCALHVLAAFHFVHDWSHSAAYLATAEETRTKLGFAYGAGVYFNYFFLVVWGVDVCWTWCSNKNSTRSTPWVILAGRWYLLFIAFNSVVVFKSGWLRAIGAIATLVLLGIAIRNRRLRSSNVELPEVTLQGMKVNEDSS